MDWSPDGTFVASGGKDRVLKMYFRLFSFEFYTYIVNLHVPVYFTSTFACTRRHLMYRYRFLI